MSESRREVWASGAEYEPYVGRWSRLVARELWDYAGEMQLMRHFWNAAVALDPSALDLDEGWRRVMPCH